MLLISAVLGMEQIGPLQWLGTALALAGALLIISGGHPETLIELETASGDDLVVIAMQEPSASANILMEGLQRAPLVRARVQDLICLDVRRGRGGSCEYGH